MTNQNDFILFVDFICIDKSLQPSPIKEKRFDYKIAKTLLIKEYVYIYLVEIL